MQTRAEPFEIKIDVQNVFETDFSKKDISGVIFQYPDTEGNICDFNKVIKAAKDNGTMTVAATDLMALTILKPPGNIPNQVTENLLISHHATFHARR